MKNPNIKRQTIGASIAGALALAMTNGSALATNDDMAATVDPKALAPAVAASSGDELIGTVVENHEGVVVGTLTSVQRADDGRLLAIIEASDLGPAPGTDRVWPLDAFDRSNGRLRAELGTAAVAATPTDAGAFEPVPGDIPLGQLTAQEVSAVRETLDPIRPFSDLDLDHDGVLSSSEAHASPRIGTEWERLDFNDDGVIDRSEFNLMTEGPAPPTAEEAPR